ncbi:MAG: hypothetical protein Q7T54_02530 [Candidatus Levybacteria bacterium]|nr:hypothetical protein [Candidatus Levybacteria bacterium]
MSFRRETLRPPVMPEQIKSGLSATSKTLQHFGAENPQFNVAGHVKFVPESKILAAEEASFNNGYKILEVLGSGGQDIKEAVFAPKQFNSEDGSAILLHKDLFSRLASVNGINIDDRKFVSSLEVKLFEMAVAGYLGINAKSVQIDDGEMVDGYIKDYRDFLSDFSSENPENERKNEFTDKYDSFVKNIKPEDLKLEVRGLRVSPTYKGEKLFTTNYTYDQDMRLLIVGLMYPEFEALMSKKYFWFSPSEKAKVAPSPDPEVSEELNDLLSSVDSSNDPGHLALMYLSGELGYKFLKQKFEQFRQEEHDQKEALARKLRESMLTRRDSNPDYSSYEFDDRLTEDPQEIEMSESEEVVVRRKRKMQPVKRLVD